MPSYLFSCNQCELVYEDIVNYDETGKYLEVECPKCNSREKEKLVTTCSFNFSNPVGTSRWNSDSTGHDYRYKYNAPAVKQERENAEKMSHMGDSNDIYRQIDDLKADKNFDFDKI